MSMPLWLSYLTRANAEIGQFDDVRRGIGEAIVAVEAAKERWCEAEVNRIAGEIALLSRPEAQIPQERSLFRRRCDSPSQGGASGTPGSDEHGAAVARSGQATAVDLVAAVAAG